MRCDYKKPDVTLKVMLLFFLEFFTKVADLSPKNMFGNKHRHRWYLSPALNIGVSPGALSGQIYKPFFYSFEVNQHDVNVGTWIK